MSMEIFNKKSENPFFGMTSTLELYQNALKGNSKFNALNAWKECKTLEQKALFFSLCFAAGDIPRQHSIFEKKVLPGGFGQREIFRRELLPVLWGIVSKSKKIDKIQFLRLVVEYTTAENIFGCRVRTNPPKTKKGKSTVKEVINMPKLFGVDVVAQVATTLYKGSDFQRLLLAKYMTLPKYRGVFTKEVTKTREELLLAFCNLNQIPYNRKEKYVDFAGYRQWRQKYNADFESVLFSTKKVFDLDREEFFQLLNQMPAEARQRTRKKLVGKRVKEQYKKLSEWYAEWDAFKASKQTEKKSLEEKVRQGMASNKDKARLAKVSKEAKVTTGAFSINASNFPRIVSGDVDDLILDAFMDKVNLPFNFLTIFDDSGSMNSGYGRPFTPRALAALLATVFLTKNQDDDARNFLMAFSSEARAFSAVSAVSTAPNRLMKGKVKEVREPFITPTASFRQNYERIKKFMDAVSTSQNTNVAALAEYVRDWISTDSEAIDVLSKYPVWVLISDGNFNNLGNATASLGAMFKLMEQKVGIKPFLVLIDVAGRNSQEISNFTGMDNIIMVPPSPENIQLILTNFRDLDVYDIYTPLQSFFRDGRYAPIRSLLEVEVQDVVEVEELVN